MGLFRKSCYTNSSNVPSIPSTYRLEDDGDFVSPKTWSAPNPNPGNFKILRVQKISDYLLVAEINYVGCTNFEGNKICVYSGLSEKELRSLTYLDPHFSKSSISPIARFKPDATGWNNACKFARSLSL